MLSYNKNIALVIGHPGHELRVFRFLELYRPRVYVLTDGSGHNGESRTANTIKILTTCGAQMSPVMGYFSDKEMYRIILENDCDALIQLTDIILADFEKNRIDIVVGDALEGFNPTHDLCRYLVNIITASFEKRTKTIIENYDFLLDKMITGNDAKEAIAIILTDIDFARKYEAATAYTELGWELKNAIQKYGTEPFKTEHLRKVTITSAIHHGDDGTPYYEKYAKGKIKEGVYKKVITFKEHVFPLIDNLTRHFNTGSQ